MYHSPVRLTIAPEHYDIEHYLQTGIVTVIPFFVIDVYFFLIPAKHRIRFPFSLLSADKRCVVRVIGGKPGAAIRTDATYA